VVSNSAVACSVDPCILQAARNIAAGTSLSHYHVERITRVRGKTDRNDPICLSFSLILDTTSALTNGGG